MALFGPIGPGRRTIKSRTYVQAGGHGADIDTAGVDPEMMSTLRGEDVTTAPADHPAVAHPFNLGTALSNTFRAGRAVARAVMPGVASAANLGKRVSTRSAPTDNADENARLSDQQLRNRGARYGKKVGI